MNIFEISETPVFRNGNGALNSTGQLALKDAEIAVAVAKAHQGGVVEGWGRILARNSFTVNPSKPLPDDKDLEKENLMAEAKKAVNIVINGGAISLHDAQVRGWIV